MSIVNVTRKWSGVGGDVSKNLTSFTEVYSVLTDNVAEPTFNVLHAPGIPQWGDAHDSAPTMYANNIRPSRPNKLLWDVAVVFVSPTAGLISNPLDEPVEIEGGGRSVIEPTDHTIDGQPICNKAGQQFDPPVQVELYDFVVTFARNDARLEQNILRRYTGAVNSDMFWGNEPGTAMIEDIRFRQIRYGAGFYYRKWYTIRFREPVNCTAAQTWQLRILNAGYEFIDVTFHVPELAKFKTSAGEPYGVPHQLNEFGGAALLGDPAIWLYFDVRPRLPFSDLYIFGGQ